MGFATALQRYDSMTYTVILVAGPPATIALLLAVRPRPRALYISRLGSALASYLAAYLGLFAVNAGLTILVALNPLLLIALIVGSEGALIAFVMALAERVRASRSGTYSAF